MRQILRSIAQNADALASTKKHDNRQFPIADKYERKAMRTRKPLVRMLSMVAVLALVTAACATETTDTTTAEAETTTTMAETTTTAAGPDLMAANIGPACSAVPADGEGSFDGMADDPAATAASNNPVLSTLVTAVVEADLVDTLNSEGPFTIFAPYNDAFAAVEGLDDIIANTELLTSILTFHVVAGESMDLQQLIDAGTVDTVNGGSLTIEASDDLATVNGANVICGNVQVANGTVHIIDAVLVPEG
jgi:uncharacterized surface protein with fasciclin (FAS1) repeats